jgi:hypothetical protein
MANNSNTNSDIPNIIRNMTKIAFCCYGTTYSWTTNPYSYFLKFQKDRLYSIRKITIKPFDSDINAFQNHFGVNVWASQESANEADEKFITHKAYQIIVSKPYGKTPSVMYEVDGFIELLSKIEELVKSLLDEGYTYLTRYKPNTEPKGIEYHDCIEYIEEQRKLQEERSILLKNLINQTPLSEENAQDILELQKSKSNKNKRKRLPDGKILVSKSSKVALKNFKVYHEAIFIRFERDGSKDGKWGLVKDALNLNRHTKFSYMDIHPVDGFPKSEKPENLFEQVHRIPIDPDKFGIKCNETELQHFEHLIQKNGFVYLYQKDSFGNTQFTDKLSDPVEPEFDS